MGSHQYDDFPQEEIQKLSIEEDKEINEYEDDEDEKQAFTSPPK